eukprot:comp23918_c0_seq1/m.42191 comp23918_c0_seq1/g.42191  ORF comp23918_c0_seq1/g.42191 comp23918_c0_seq1/m.42191 type:complete len:695 (-) comp23918_c0_seq1:288-2372(-)
MSTPRGQNGARAPESPLGSEQTGHVSFDAHTEIRSYAQRSNEQSAAEGSSQSDELEMDGTEHDHPELLLEAMPPVNEQRELLILALAMESHTHMEEGGLVDALISTAEETGVLHDDEEDEETPPRVTIDKPDEETEQGNLVSHSHDAGHGHLASSYRDTHKHYGDHLNDLDHRRRSAIERLEEMVHEPEFHAALGWIADDTSGDEGTGTFSRRSSHEGGEGARSRHISSSSAGKVRRSRSRSNSKARPRRTSASDMLGYGAISDKNVSGEDLLTSKDTDSEEEGPIHPYQMSLFFGFFNLVNDIATASIVTIPYYVVISGLPMGLFMLFFLAALGHAMLMVLHRLTLERSLNSFCETCYLAFGMPGYLIAAAAIFVFNYGATFIGGLMMLAGMLPDILVFLFGQHAIFERTYILLVSIIVLSPLAFKKHMDSFNIISTISVCIAITIVFGVCIHAAMHMLGPDHPKPAGSLDVFRPKGMLEGMGGMAYLYACHDLAYHISTTLERNTMKRYGVVAGLSCYVPMAIMAVMSVAAWLVFGDATEANILDSYARSEPVAVVLRVLLSLNIILNIAYSLYMPRVAILSLIQLRYPEYVLTMPDNARARNIVHSIVTLVLLVIGFVVADNLTDLGKVFAFVGGVAGIAISTLLPALCWLRLGPKLERFDMAVRACMWVVAAFGVCTMVMVAYDTFKPEA